MPAPFDDDARRPTSLAEVLRVARAWLQGGWRAAHDIEPDFWRNLKREFLAGCQWFDRAIVLAFAAATGAILVGFTLLAEAAIHGFRQVESRGEHGPHLTLLWTPALTVAMLWWTRRYVPGALGSGIPQVVRALDDDLQPSQRDWLASMRVSMHKIGPVSGGLLASLSIGREGPTVQVGAGVMVSARRWLSPQSGIDAHDLMVAGAAAGIAAAFNTPLGGIVFALEQLTRRRHISHSSLVTAAIVLSGPVAVFGNETYFGRMRVQAMSWSLPAGVFAPSLATGAGIGHDVALFMGMNRELAAMLPLPPPTEPRQGKT